jgi:hypothetical protein
MNQTKIKQSEEEQRLERIKVSMDNGVMKFEDMDWLIEQTEKYIDLCK